MISVMQIKNGFISLGGKIFRAEGFDVMLDSDRNVIGWSCKAGTELYQSLKREFIREMNKLHLKILKEHFHRDLHLVFDGTKYIQRQQQEGGGIDNPLVVVMLYRSDAKLIAAALEYPVIDNSQFN